MIGGWGQCPIRRLSDRATASQSHTTNHPLPHGYAIDPSVKPIIDAYTAEGFDFIALRLLPGQGVQQMKPVRVVTPGMSPTLPLRMVAAGTGANVAITLFVIGEGRYEAQNFPNAPDRPCHAHLGLQHPELQLRHGPRRAPRHERRPDVEQRLRAAGVAALAGHVDGAPLSITVGSSTSRPSPRPTCSRAWPTGP